MKKKGFTLIEIIVCVILISIIGTTIVIGVNNKNKKDEAKNKKINDIISATDVYYSMDTNLQDKLNENDGYLVVSIDELKNKGLIDNNFLVPELTEEETNSNKNYNKILILNRYKDYQVRLLTNSSDDTYKDDIGYIDFIYPFEPNIPYISKLDDITLESFEKEKLKCLNYSDEDHKLYYVDENYEMKSIDNYKCKYDDIDYDKGTNIPLNSNNRVKYITTDLEKEINVIVNPEPNMVLIAKKLNEINSIYTCGEWTNDSIKLSVEDSAGVLHPNFKYIFNYVSGGEIYNGDNNYYEFDTSQNVKVKYIQNGILTNNTTEILVGNCEIKIDKDVPIVEEKKISSKLNIVMKDNNSGLSGYYISDTQIDIEDYDTITYITLNTNEYALDIETIKNENKYIYVKDKAGNV